jgi:hypothetical protein
MILFVSCTKEVKFDGEQKESKLVINCLCEPEKPIKARITKSYFMLDYYGNSELHGAVDAKLYVNGNFQENLVNTSDTIDSSGQDDPVYMSQYLPNVGDVVKIQVSSAGFVDAEGTSEAIPDVANFQSTLEDLMLQWQYDYEYYDWEGDTSYCYSSYSGNANLQVTLTDNNPEEMDYYYLHFALENHSETPNYHGRLNIQYTDPIFDPVGLNSGLFDFEIYNNEGLFSDKFFAGKSYTIKIPIDFALEMPQEAQSDFSLSVSVKHVSKAYFNYLSTCGNGNNMDGMAFFTEPMQIYSNVENGFGIVGSVNEKTQSIPLIGNKK